MKVTIVKPAALTAELVKCWSEIQQSTETLASPFFAPAFTCLVDRHRNDVEVAVVEDGQQLIGFFPFQRSKGNHGKPVGWKINDYQGFVSRRNFEIDATQLLKQCRLKSWKFDHLIASSWSESYVRETGSSPGINLEKGYDAYLGSKLESGGKTRFKSLQRQSRVLARDHGDLRFIFNSTSPEILKTTLDWKRKQLIEQGARNAYEQKWALNTVFDVLQTEEVGFQGVLSALYAGEHLVAAHMGIIGNRLLHWWIPAYNREFAKYSPGSILLMELLKSCHERGITEIDLGKGDSPFKQLFQNKQQLVYEGTVTVNHWQRLKSSAVHHCRKFLRQMQLARYAKTRLIKFRRFLTSQSQ